MNSVVQLDDVRPAPPESPPASIEAALPTIDAATRDALNDWLRQRCTPVFRTVGWAESAKPNTSPALLLGCADSAQPALLRAAAEEFGVEWLAEVQADWLLIMELSVGMHRAVLAVDGFAALDPLLVGEPFMLMPAALRDLVVQRLLARVLTRAPAALANALEIRALHWERCEVPDWRCRLPFVLRRRSDGTQMVGTLFFETAHALKWLHGVLPIDSASAQTELSLPVPLRLVVGSSTIGASALHELEVGDVVWIETASIARDGIEIDLNAPAAGRRWRCRARRQLLKVIAAVDRPPDSAGGQASACPSMTGAQTMNAQRWQLDVPVTFDLGELHLKLADLQRLQPGQVIELQQDVATAAVTLRVADRPIAEGTLIAVGKRLGVRVAAILAPQESSATPTAAG